MNFLDISLLNVINDKKNICRYENVCLKEDSEKYSVHKARTVAGSNYVLRSKSMMAFVNIVINIT